MIYRFLIAGVTILLLSAPAWANPTQFGSTGLLNVPSAETLDAGNVCIGVWGNCSDGPSGNSVIAPVALTLGIGSFWEFYGTYPNVLLNNNEQASGRGTVDVGTKMRIYGQRNSKVKLAANLFLSRHLDNDPVYDGQTDFGGELVASARTDRLGISAYGGYVSNSDYRGKLSDKEYPGGVGIDFNLTQRTKLIGEFTAKDLANLDAPAEASVGFQFYISPHLTFNLSTGFGVTGNSQDWRVLFGLTTCQGVGTYIKPIPKIGPRGQSEGKLELVRPTKIIPLSPLLVRVPARVSPVSKYEVPVDPDKEEIIIRPYGQILIQQQPAATPVSLPRNILLDQPDETPEKPANDSLLAPMSSPQDVRESKAVEYTLTRVSGVTPLYGVGVKRQQATPEPVAELSQPVRVNSVSVYKKFRLPDTLFEFGQSELSDDVKKALSEVAELIRKDSKWTYLRIDGHTDSIGSVKYNLDLSLKRAIAVANYLITREGIDPAKVFVKGMGKSAPIGENKTDDGRRLNRRFEILFLVQNGN